jgi:hypothetical protein
MQVLLAGVPSAPEGVFLAYCQSSWSSHTRSFYAAKFGQLITSSLMSNDFEMYISTTNVSLLLATSIYHMLACRQQLNSSCHAVFCRHFLHAQRCPQRIQQLCRHKIYPTQRVLLGTGTCYKQRRVTLLILQHISDIPMTFKSLSLEHIHKMSKARMFPHLLIHVLPFGVDLQQCLTVIVKKKEVV